MPDTTWSERQWMHRAPCTAATPAPASMPTSTPIGVGMERAATAAQKAPARIIPSTPTLTTPERSHSVAPRVAKTSAGKYSSVEDSSASNTSSTWHLRTRSGRRLGGRLGRAPRLAQQGEPHLPARDEEQGQALDELGVALVHAEQLHARAARAQRPEEERRERHPERVAVADEGDGDAVEAVGGAQRAGVAQLGAQHQHRA